MAKKQTRPAVLIPYDPTTWSESGASLHRAATLEAAFHNASCLAGGWYRRPVTIDWRVTPDNNEEYMLRPSEVARLDGWHSCFQVEAVR